MRIAPYWVRGMYEGRDSSGRLMRFEAFGWSFTSPAEAETMARERG